MAKGSQYERDICRTLSSWWKPPRDDIFWRSDASGGRAKSRAQKGKSTFGKHGDIVAVDPIGLPLIKLFTIEVKRGYSGSTPNDLLDMPESSAIQVFDEWIEQTMESWQNSKSRSWCIISKRDRREAIITFPKQAYNVLRLVGGFRVPGPMPLVQFRFVPYCQIHKIDVVIMRLDAFLRGIRRDHVERSLLEQWP